MNLQHLRKSLSRACPSNTLVLLSCAVVNNEDNAGHYLQRKRIVNKSNNYVCLTGEKGEN